MMLLTPIIIEALGVAGVTVTVAVVLPEVLDPLPLPPLLSLGVGLGLGAGAGVTGTVQSAFKPRARLHDPL